jgi:hypothetical protein
LNHIEKAFVHSSSIRLGEIKQDRVHVAALGARDELLGLMTLKFLKLFTTRSEHFERVGPLDVEIRHVVRLVEETGFAPGPLLVSPIGELVTHDGEGVGADLRIAQQLHGAAGGLDGFFKVPVGHG